MSIIDIMLGLIGASVSWIIGYYWGHKTATRSYIDKLRGNNRFTR